MKRKSILWLLPLFMSANVFANDGETIFMTDSGVKVPVGDISAIVTADEDATFTVVRHNDDAIYGVSSLKNAAVTLVNAINIGEHNAPEVMIAIDKITISNCRQGAKIIITDLRGIIVCDAISDSSSATINVSELERGIYVLSIDSDAIKFVKR